MSVERRPSRRPPSSRGKTRIAARYAILDGVDAGKLEFQVGKGEDDYKLFSPEEYSKIRRLDVGGGGGK